MSKLVIVAPEFNAYGGAHVLHAKDLGLAAESFPDRKVAELGCKKVIDPEHLKPFGKLRARAWAVAEKRGIRLLDGYGQNPDLAKEVVAEIQAICREAQSHADFIGNNWLSLVDEWAKANPKWSTLVRESAPSAQWIRSRFHFAVRAYPMDLGTLQEMGIEENDLISEMGGLGDRLISDLSHAAKGMWEEFISREKILERQISPLKTMAEKAKALGFLDKRAVTVGQDIQALLDTLPAKGPYEAQLPEILKTLRKVMKLTLPEEEASPLPAAPVMDLSTPIWAA